MSNISVRISFLAFYSREIYKRNTYIIYVPAFLLPKVAADESCSYDRKRSGTTELDCLAAEDRQQPAPE